MTETEAHVAAFGWDQPVRVFALVRTDEALAADPDIAELLDAATVEESRTDPELLMVVEQEGLPAAADLEDLLGQLAWPQAVDGAALAVERVVLPPEAEQEAAKIHDAQERLAFLSSRSDREDVRIVVGVLRTGESWCAVRSRAQDSADRVVSGDALVPGLIEALGSTLV